jgi:esterase/lipase superfamily enzyme/acyl carrier protein
MRKTNKLTGLFAAFLFVIFDIAVAQNLQPTRDDVLAEIATFVGVEIDALDTADDLIEDLLVDLADVFQLIAMLCDQYERPLPEGDEITVVGELVSYIVETRPRVATRGVVLEDAEQRVVSLYYGTDRERTYSDDPVDFFNGNRSVGGQIHYGTVDVTIPSSHRVGQLETPFLGLQILSSPRRHITVSRITPLSSRRFWSSITDDLDASDAGEEVVLFIHGYKNSFEAAARRTAQIVVDMADMGFEFVPLFYSWPSDNTLLGYMSDREDVMWSVGHIEQFIRDLTERAPSARIHLIAHSMGSQGLLNALRMLSRDPRAPDQALFENVLLAAPDFDAEVFEQQLANDEFLRLSRRWTIYTSDRDNALKASVSINSVQRLGLPIVAVPGVDMIDATGLDVTPWNVPEFHSYYATKQSVIADVASVFSGRAPIARQLLRESLENRTYWRLPVPE